MSMFFILCPILNPFVLLRNRKNSLKSMTSVKPDDSTRHQCWRCQSPALMILKRKSIRKFASGKTVPIYRIEELGIDVVFPMMFHLVQLITI